MIDNEAITQVLLPDGWHKVIAGSFEIQPFRLGLAPWDLEEDQIGFLFDDPTATVAGPLSSILAVRGEDVQ